MPGISITIFLKMRLKNPAETGVKYLNLTEKEAQGQVVMFSIENYAFSSY